MKNCLFVDFIFLFNSKILFLCHKVRKNKQNINNKRKLLSTVNKLIYMAPELELIEMEVEQGFAASPQVVENLNDFGYGDEHSAMD